MSRNRKKVYEQGDRINIYLSRDLTTEFIEWINSQSDLSNFFLYAAQQLYEKTGFVDVAEVMPRKINFNISKHEQPVTTTQTLTVNRPVTNTQPMREVEEVTNEVFVKEDEEDKVSQNFSDDSPKENNSKASEGWGDLSDMDDDPYA